MATRVVVTSTARDDNDSLRVLAVDYGANELTVDRAIVWSAGEGVSYPFQGTAPDMGANEFNSVLIGDTNLDGQINAADVIVLVNFVFKSGPAPAPGTGDTNCDGQINSADIIVLVNFVFKSGPAPCTL